MRNGIVRKIILAIAVAIFAAAVMTLLSAVPPLSYLHDWAERNDAKFVWYGVTAGVVALCWLLYHYHLKK